MKQGKVVKVERGTAPRKGRTVPTPMGKPQELPLGGGVHGFWNKCRMHRAKGLRVCDDARPDATT
jgi:hypothetical protein